MFKSRFVVIAATVGVLGSVLFSATSFAADNGLYLGAGVSRAAIDVDSNNATVPAFDGDNTKFKLIAGVRPLDWIAFEVNYVDFGKVSTPAGTLAASQAEFSLKGYDAFAVGLYEIGLVDLFVKAGGIRWNSSFDAASTAIADGDDSGFDFAYGGGVGLHFGSIGVRAEYEKFNVERSDVDMVTLGVTWTFL